MGNLPQQSSEESSSTKLTTISSSLLHIIVEVSEYVGGSFGPTSSSDVVAINNCEKRCLFILRNKRVQRITPNNNITN